MAGNQEKAYKLLAMQEGISNNEAKKLIDDGFVFIGTRKVNIARAEVEGDTKFLVRKPGSAKKVFEDDNLIVLDKPAGYESYALEKEYPEAKLLHRLDKPTSGLLLLAKNEEFRLAAIEEFKELRVRKEYLAMVSGIIAEPVTVDLPISTVKGKSAKSRIDQRGGKSAVTEIEPLAMAGKKTKVRAVILTGRTHQIRVHLAHLGHPILGDALYGGREWRRMMLHAEKIALLGYEFTAPEPGAFHLE